MLSSYFTSPCYRTGLDRHQPPEATASFEAPSLVPASAASSSPRQTDETPPEGASPASSSRHTGAWAIAGVALHRLSRSRQPRHHGRPRCGDRPMRILGCASWPGPCGSDPSMGCADVVRPRTKFSPHTVPHFFKLFSPV
jgi:hypothetical protein